MSTYSFKEVAPEEWEAFVFSQELTPFVQSFKYGEFYASLGEDYWIIGMYEGATLIGGSLIVSTHAKRGTFLYLPYGPLIDYSNTDIVQAFFTHIRSFAKKHGCDFVRVSPILDDSEEGRAMLKQAGLKPAPMHVLAENSWLLDLTPDEDALLSGMKKNHRNLVRRCEREGVSIQSGTGQELMNIVHDTLDETEKRLDFTRFSRSYIEKEFEQYAGDDQMRIFVSRLPSGKADAAAIIAFYGNMSVYRHSGSLNLDKKLPSSYLIQWEVIKEAKRRGMKWYNFWGVNPADQADHPFAGIGHFKRGFGGQQRDFIHAHDMPITLKYWFNWLVETIRRRKRGF